MLLTISNQYGCGGVAIAHRAAEALGYEYVDDQLPVVVARRLKTSPQAVELAEDVGKSMSERMLQALESGTPEIRGAPASFDEACLREVREAVREFAARGNAVIVGRGANAILGRRSDVVRVFLHAPRDWRMRRLVETHGISESAALGEIDRIDRARRQYVRAYYDIDWGDPQNYDLSLDTSTFGLDASADVIVQAVRAR